MKIKTAFALLPILAAACLLFSGLQHSALAAPTDATAVPANISKVFEANCVSCHGPKKSKGKITLHDIDGGLAVARLPLLDAFRGPDR